MQTIPDNLLNSPVQGVNLRAGSLADQLDQRETLLVFLRHFG